MTPLHETAKQTFFCVFELWAFWFVLKIIPQILQHGLPDINIPSVVIIHEDLAQQGFSIFVGILFYFILFFSFESTTFATFYEEKFYSDYHLTIDIDLVYSGDLNFRSLQIFFISSLALNVYLINFKSLEIDDFLVWRLNSYYCNSEELFRGSFGELCV